MLDREMFLLRARLTATELDTFVEAGWISLASRDQGFSEADLCRAHLIRTLREECGVNDEGVDVALRLLDQLHGARRALAELAALIRTLPEPLRSELAAVLRTAPDARAGL